MFFVDKDKVYPHMLIKMCTSQPGGIYMSRNRLGKQPNILLIIVDQERYPPVYEDAAVRAWSQKNLHASRQIRWKHIILRLHST